MASNPGSTEETLTPAHPVGRASHEEILEINFSVKTGTWRTVVRLDCASRVSTLKSIFSSIIVTKIQTELRQESLLGTNEGFVLPSGHIFCALIPTGKNVELSTGTSGPTVNTVPNKQSFPLSRDTQASRVYDFDLTGFELDLACDPRRNQGIVLWLGNNGVTNPHGVKEASIIASSTWRVWVTCSGNSTLW